MVKTKKETKFGEYFNLPNPNLRAYFGRVVSGQPEEYRTTFYKGRSLKEILSGWQKILEKCPDVTKFPSLLTFENDLAKKVGPLSIMKPLAERMADIDSYYEGILLPSKPISREAIGRAWAEWGKFGGLRLRDERHVVEEMKLSTNSGSPYFAKRRSVVEKTLPISWSGLYNLSETATMWYTEDKLSGIPDCEATIGSDRRTWRQCAVLGWRGQEGGPSSDDVKQRVVWMFPFAINIREHMAYQPLVEALQHKGGVPAWIGMEAVDEEITQLFDTKQPGDLIVVTDFSKFDQHFNPHLSFAAKSLLTMLFSGDSRFQEWVKTVFDIKYGIPLAYDWGKIRYGWHGMASGSAGTNADETLAHRCLQHEAALNAGKQLNPHSQCLGDDGILSYPGITVDDVVKTYSSHGQVVNHDKQYASTTDCVYLRRWHHTDYRHDGICVGVYSTYRALGRLAEQERYYDPEVWGPKAVALRQLSIIENCKWHPAREQFAEYCMKGDRYRLGLDIPGFLDNIASESKKLIEYMPDFLGYTKSLGVKDPTKGIENWWIVKFLKSKA
jgi:hypothetical protein